MQVKNQISFGMGYRIPGKCKNIKKIEQYIGLPKNERAYANWATKQNEIYYYDTRFADNSLDIEVISNLGKGVVAVFKESPKGVTGLDYPGAFKWPGRKLFNKIFYPEKLLPQNMVLAAEKCKELNKAYKIEL